ncbi:CHAT domain-containing protein [Actinomadura nitritigenes]|uniref:CHAT domain-containing protein n=1 Tax=Actinomadura nitritigenes TaxID=134602 RepID=UPI003D8AFFA7
MERIPGWADDPGLRRQVESLNEADRAQLLEEHAESELVREAMGEIVGVLGEPERILEIARRRPELLSTEADRQLWFAIESLDRDRSDTERIIAELLETLRDFLLSLRRDGPGEWEDAVSTREQGPADPLARAALLVRTGRPEEGITAIEDVRRIAREAGDWTMVGEAELMYCMAYQVLSGEGPERMRVLRERSQEAEAAFRRANDASGIVRALERQVGVMLEHRDSDAVQYVLGKLERMDADAARWWSRYAVALLSAPDDLDAAAAALAWCAENTALLDPAERKHWEDECQRKLDVLTGTPLAARPPRSLRDRIAAALEAADPGRRLVQVLDEAEALRTGISSAVKQRELSAYLEGCYLLAAHAAGEAGAPESAMDIRERNTSRALLSQPLMTILWDHAGDQPFRETAEINTALVRAKADGDERALRYWLARRREADGAAEERVRAARKAPVGRRFTPASCSRLLRVLAPEDAVVQYSPDGAVSVLTDRGVRAAPPYDPDALAEACAAYLGSVRDSDARGRRSAEGEIERACVAPLCQHLGAKERVFLIPSGPLWGVPLGTIGAMGLPRCSVVPSMSVLERLLQRRLPARRLPLFFGMADPDGSLPHAAAEVAEAASCFPDAFTLTGDALDFEAILNLMDVDVAHIGCHGEFFADYPELSYLHIAGAGRRAAWLFCHDLTRVALSARLLVVAACHAGNGVALPGNEYVGFPGSLLVQGAQTVLAPLWAIDDRSTGAFMRHYHRHYARERSAYAALRHAQERLRADRPTADPVHWAGFQLFGLP